MKKKFSLNTKQLIFDAIKTKLEGENVSKVLLNFALHSNDYSVHIKPKDSDKSMIYEIDPKEVTMIKRLFVSKMKRKIENVENYKHIILCIDLEKEDFDLFLNDNKNNVTKFNA